MSRENKGFVKALVGVLIIFVGLGWAVSYSQSQRMVTNSRAGCERAKLDRKDNAAALRDVALEADHPLTRLRFESRATRLEKRSLVDCEQVYPDASLLP